MNFSLSYGHSQIVFSMPDNVCKVIVPPSIKNKNPIPHPLYYYLDNPIDSEKLSKFLYGKKKILIVISDATRKTGSEELLPLLERYFNKNNIITDDIKIIISTGIHRKPTGEEIEKLCGGAFKERAILIEHDSSNMSEMDFYGKTSYGNSIYLNKHLKWADAVVVIGGVGFHYFAGFSGGRKSILPGLAHEESIKFNHNLVFLKNSSGRNPNVHTASLENNPVHLDMIEVLKMIGLEKLFFINTIISHDGILLDIICGHPITSFYESCRRYEQGHSVNVDKLADLVIISAGGYPRDINMVQAHKTIEMGRYALRMGGKMVVLAECSEGMGHPSFFPWFRFKSEEEFRKELIKNYVINGQTALAVFEKAKNFDITFVSELKPEYVKQMNMKPESDPVKAVKNAIENMEHKDICYVIPYGGVTLCIVQQE